MFDNKICKCDRRVKEIQRIATDFKEKSQHSIKHTGIRRGKNSLIFSGGNWASQYADLPITINMEKVASQWTKKMKKNIKKIYNTKVKGS